MHKIPNISKTLNDLINDLLRYDDSYDLSKSSVEYSSVLLPGKEAERKLTEMGLIDDNKQFVEPDTLSGELAIAAQWLKDNI